ncbi:MAG: CopG family transcriptional regulator [Candidatus Nanopelagicales bacterium]|nr:CopG family transcriptional regulator [Candidatus Nanopelagicales bacterium]MDZ4249171.1 CopG family transcriptional regulator [Candidatus Nanopelagicales bacterium]
MTATRTQIYLSDEQRRRIDKICRDAGVPMAEVIRDAVDRYLEAEFPNPDDALKETFGADPAIDVPPRGEWDRG